MADLEIWKRGFKVVGIAHKAAKGDRQQRITCAAEQPKYGLKKSKGGALPLLNLPLNRMNFFYRIGKTTVKQCVFCKYCVTLALVY